MGGGDKTKDSSSNDGEDCPEAPSSVALEVVGDWMKLPVARSEITVMARLSACTGEGEEEEGHQQRVPITICAAIDRSGSMKEHLPLLRETLCFMVQQLRSEDKLCLITFDHEVHVELPLTAMDANGKLHAEQAIGRMKERGHTNLSGGLLAALEALYRIKSSEASLVESVLLFTDGRANVGIRDQPTLVKATKSLLEQINRQPCVFTFGYGSEHDADLLHSVAEAGNGLFYYIDNSDSIPESFCDCLGGLLSVAAQNVKLTFSGKEKTSVGRPLTSYRVSEKEAGHCYQVTIPDMYCEEERCILTTLNVPADLTITEPTTVSIVTCTVEFFDVLAHKQREETATFSVVRNKSLVNPIPSDAQDDIELHRVRCEVAGNLGQANALASRGNIPAAKELLYATKHKIKQSVVAARPLAVYLLETLDESLVGLEDKVTYSEHGKAVMVNYAGSHWQQRSNTKPSRDGYIRAKLAKRAASPLTPSPSPCPSSSASSMHSCDSLSSPYVNFSKETLKAKHSSLSSKSTQ